MRKHLFYFNFLKKILIINLIGFGGSPITVGYYQREFVEENFITNSELNQYVALANLLPGAMSFYVSGYIGYKLFKSVGLIVGVLTCVFPIMIITIIVYNLLLLTQLDLNNLILFVYHLLSLILISMLVF